MSEVQQPENYQANARTIDNTGYYNATALQIRLNVDPVVRQIEMYLKGEREEVVPDKYGSPTSRVQKIGEPLANALGIQAIMNLIETVFNPQVVQGNFEGYDEYAEYLIRFRKDMSMLLMVNIHTYGIKEEYYSGMISTIMRFIEAFMSRLIANKERESYAQTIKSFESSQTQQGKSGFKIPFFN